MEPYSQLPGALFITSQDRETMRGEVERVAPEEACGLIAGRPLPDGYHAEWIIPTTNSLHSPERYFVEGKELVAVFQEIDKRELELIGIYHSHPRGPDEPSPTDVDEAYYPETAYLIWSKRTGEWRFRAFMIQNRLIIEIPLLVVN